jgi:hypothetical protein
MVPSVNLSLIEGRMGDAAWQNCASVAHPPSESVIPIRARHAAHFLISLPPCFSRPQRVLEPCYSGKSLRSVVEIQHSHKDHHSADPDQHGVAAEPRSEQPRHSRSPPQITSAAIRAATASSASAMPATTPARNAQIICGRPRPSASFSRTSNHLLSVSDPCRRSADRPIERRASGPRRPASGRRRPSAAPAARQPAG